MKLCKDCEYSSSADRYANCNHENSRTDPHPVTGVIGQYFCSTIRNYGPCGEDAIYFTPKIKISDKLKSKAKQLFGKYFS